VPRHLDAIVAGEDGLEGLGEQAVVVGDDDPDLLRKLLVTGDNRLKQGVDPAKVRQSYEQALEAAREAGLEDAIRPLVEIRLADLDRRESAD
jgi:hypothetical protein